VLLALVTPDRALPRALVDPVSRSLRLQVDASADRLLPEDAPARAFYDRTLRRFGSDKALVLVIGLPDVFEAGALARLRALSESLAALPEVSQVLSLANAPDLRAEEGDVVVEPFLAELPASAAEREALRRSVLANPLYGGSLVARDARATALLVRVRT